MSIGSNGQYTCPLVSLGSICVKYIYWVQCVLCFRREHLQDSQISQKSFGPLSRITWARWTHWIDSMDMDGYIYHFTTSFGRPMESPSDVHLSNGLNTWDKDHNSHLTKNCSFKAYKWNRVGYILNFNHLSPFRNNVNGENILPLNLAWITFACASGNNPPPHRPNTCLRGSHLS